ncbi:hypothetical protein GLOIN_2v1767763 [Rhizophagus irregularis DAOM 181602=DAOM 197198]|nr:hypothetical protein GLOIN_2v1767763 [Rhizophagus irregularis DAOM 181602=DAOM 197198]
MQKIFKYTIQISNKKNLFKLLLVNKYWCENVIPILWNNPFRDLFPPSILRHTPSRDPRICYNLLRTYISCLDNDEYYLLFSKLNPSLHPFDMEIPNSFKTLYNYPNYLKELSYSDLENTIYTSFMINLKNSNSKNSNFQQEKYQAFSIASALCKLFLQNSTQLKFLLFNSSSTCNDRIDLVCNKENIDIILNYCPNIIVLFIMNNDLMEWREKFNTHSKKVFIKNLNIKRIITTKSTTSKPSNNNNNRYCKEF